MQRFFALILFIFFLPLIIFLFILIVLISENPFIFRQKRMGKGKKVFTIYKLRTMVKDAEKLKSKYLHLNETDGPVFKIRNDPRYTSIGRFLARTALDELPQLINIIKGEMAFVGPRPLPVEEARNVPKKYDARFSILPGLTSTWVIKGSHQLKFEQWMELDLKYVKNKTLWGDFEIILKTFFLIFKSLINIRR